MQRDSPALVAAADVVPQDVLMVDNDNKTFLFLRLQGLTAIKKKKRRKKYHIKMSSNIQEKTNRISFIFDFVFELHW